ncbi:MAG: hypothetical protein HZA50_12585 [Planctomycetes bacterium]|nr:hypothetical protein [Planctomycetota bacterium]
MIRHARIWAISAAFAAWAFLGIAALPAETPAKITENAKKELERLKDKRLKEFRHDLLNALRTRCGSNAQAADAAGAAAWTSYTHLLPDQQAAMEKEYPGLRAAAKKLADDQVLTTDELANMCRLLGIAPRAGAADPPAYTKHEVTVRDGNKTTRDSVTNSQAGTVTAHGVTVKDGNMTTNDTTVNAPKSTVTEHSVTVKDGNTVTRDTTVDAPKGTVTGHEVITRQDDSVTRDATVTGPAGTKTAHDEWNKEGNTVTRDGQTVRPDGSTVARGDTWTKTDNTVQHSGTVTGPKGTSTRQDTVVKDGNTVTQTASLTKADGSVVTGSAVTVKDGNKVTRDATITGAAGTFTFHSVAMWTKNVWKSISWIIAPDGQKSTRESIQVRHGDTTDGHTVVHVPGATIVRDDRTVRDGNATVRDTTIRGDIGKVNAWRSAAHQGLYFVNQSWNIAMSLFKPAPAEKK